MSICEIHEKIENGVKCEILRKIRLHLEGIFKSYVLKTIHSVPLILSSKCEDTVKFLCAVCFKKKGKNSISVFFVDS